MPTSPSSSAMGRTIPIRIRKGYSTELSEYRSPRRSRMPGFAKSPPELIARFHEVTDQLSGAERRLMFGYPTLFVGGNMVSGLYESTWFVRLAEPERSVLLAVEG